MAGHLAWAGLMITLQDYFGKWLGCPDQTPERTANAEKLLDAVNKLLHFAANDNVVLELNYKTKTLVSGEEYGGFRPQSCPIGAPKSAHKEGLAVDIYDPTGELDGWCLLSLDRLAQCGIYLEHPSTTTGWSHWTIRRPGSGVRVFYP